MLYEKGIEKANREMKTILKLQRSESFYIRDGWIEKVFYAYNNDQRNAFSSKLGTRILGIGSNMVKSLRYWVEACQLVSSFGKDSFALSEKGMLLLENDPYMESIFSWGLLHYWLVTNEKDAPVFFSIFNNRSINSIKKKETSDYLFDLFVGQGVDNPNLLSIQKDVSTFISSYVFDDEDDNRNPEENLSCPLSKLKLIKRINRDTYIKTPVSASFIDYRLLFICLRERYPKKSFNIDDLFVDDCSPVLCFNMERSLFLSLLNEMKKKDLIDMNRTAGLNVVYIRSDISDDSLFKEYLNEKGILQI